MESARPATTADLDVIAKIAQTVAAELSRGRGGLLFLAREAWAPSLAERLETALVADDQILVAGCYDDVVCGYGLAKVEGLGGGELLGVVEDLAVEATMREVGIGEAIMDLLIELLQERGCVGVDSRALPGDRHTKNFFESFGLKARLLVVHRSFANEDASA